MGNYFLDRRYRLIEPKVYIGGKKSNLSRFRMQSIMTHPVREPNRYIYPVQWLIICHGCNGFPSAIIFVLIIFF